MKKCEMIYEMLELLCSYYHDHICEISQHSCRDTSCNGYKAMKKILDAGYLKASDVVSEMQERLTNFFSNDEITRNCEIDARYINEQINRIATEMKENKDEKNL